ncbi:hypothetical protein ACW9HR_37875 [Nocardia gipuzkoensis]
MGFALPHLPDGFASPSQKGFPISAGLIGMATGAVLVAPLAVAAVPGSLRRNFRHERPWRRRPARPRR